MAAATLGTINPDTAYGHQLLQGQQILVIPVSANNTNTVQLDPRSNPTSVAWRGTAATDWAVATLAASTGVVTIATDGGTDPHAGDLIVFYGGKS